MSMVILPTHSTPALTGRGKTEVRDIEVWPFHLLNSSMNLEILRPS